MQYVCDADAEKTWFRIETEAEAAMESQLMSHAVEKHFRRAYEEALQSYRPPDGPEFEQYIGREAHVRRTMPMFLTLRDADGQALVTAMLPQGGWGFSAASPIIVGQANGDPYREHAAAIQALGQHVGRTLDRLQCYPYRR
ncbi:MAG TPA: hypothetical protein VD970_08560 [Acetobacteraceae bacterium]|nr:hypothetical protein [Acetobacteraceae bacterium]